MSNNNLTNNNLTNNKLISDYVDQYYNLIKNYTEFFNKNLIIYNNTHNHNFLYNKGLYVINNVYNIYSLYNNSLSEIYLLSEKSFVYYIEFLNQINTNIDNGFDLTVTDAIIFSYKKTIFTIENQINNVNVNKHILKYIKLYTTIINELFIIQNKYINVSNYINNNNNNNNNNNKEIFNIFKIYKKILNVNNYNYIDNINNFLKLFIDNINNKYDFDNKYSNKNNINSNSIIIFNNIDKFINKKIYQENINDFKTFINNL